LKKRDNLENPQKKIAPFKCERCYESWYKPVNYYIRRPHQAVAALVDHYEIKICGKCLKREIGKTTWYKEFINEN
jgi:hypothetical protein